MNDVLTGNFAPPRWDFWPSDAIRVVNWNIDRGMRLQEVTDFLESQKADLLILQGRVHNTVDASDHYPISLVLRFRDQ
jgi:hypothetical protein